MTPTATATAPMKMVRIIQPTVNPTEQIKKAYRQIRVAAYCRVSTKQEEQLNSYENQVNYYTEKVNGEPKWTLVGKGDAILNKTYISDCITKKVKVNDGIARPKFYVENSHPAIIDAGTFGRVQEEIARRAGKRKVKQVGTKTDQGKYSSKYALTELLICGECGTPYRRCTWTVQGKKKIVWRCINRLDYGKKYCHTSPTVEESVLQEAIVRAIQSQACQNTEVLQTLRLHIGMGLNAANAEDNSMDIEVRIAEINATFKQMVSAVSADNESDFDEEKLNALMM